MPPFFEQLQWCSHLCSTGYFASLLGESGEMKLNIFTSPCGMVLDCSWDGDWLCSLRREELVGIFVLELCKRSGKKKKSETGFSSLEQQQPSPRGDENGGERRSRSHLGGAAPSAWYSGNGQLRFRLLCATMLEIFVPETPDKAENRKRRWLIDCFGLWFWWGAFLCESGVCWHHLLSVFGFNWIE